MNPEPRDPGWMPADHPGMTNSARKRTCPFRRTSSIRPSTSCAAATPCSTSRDLERQPRVLRDHHRPACRGRRRQGRLPARHGGASASLAGAAQGAGSRLQPARLQGRQRRRSRQGRQLLLRERHHLRLRRAAVPGPHAAIHRSRRLPLELYAKMDKRPHLLRRYDLYKGCHPQRLDHFNVFAARSAGHRRFLRPARLPPDRICRGGRPERRIAAAWMHRKGNVHDFAFTNGTRPAPASRRLLGADGDEHPASVRRDGVHRLPRRTSSAAPAGTASPTRSSFTSAIPTATASRSTPATTSPWIPTTSRCAGR